MDKHYITREIGIDAGHRVTHHGSKCRNLHGHRYKIQATCSGQLFETGEQEGMVLDFGFLKEEMMDCIDDQCDHRMILWDSDPIWLELINSLEFKNQVEENIKKWGYFAGEARPFGKIYIIPFVPTAENLAKHWFQRLEGRVAQRTDERAELVQVKVWETPNCSAIYRRPGCEGQF